MAPPPLKNWRITSRKSLTHDVIEVKVAPQDGLTFRPGQYMSVVIPGAGPGGRNLRRAYSIASPPEWQDFELCIKLVPEGPGTTYLNSLQVGDEIQAQLPFGSYVLEHDPSLPALFIATGTGIAPHRSMLLSKEWKQTGPLGFLMGVRNELDILYPELFGPDRPRQLRDHEHVKLALSLPTDSWEGYRGRVTDYLREMDWDFARSHYYLCGNGAMITEVKEFLMNSKAVPKAQIHTEKYY